MRTELERVKSLESTLLTVEVLVKSIEYDIIQGIDVIPTINKVVDYIEQALFPDRPDLISKITS